MQGIKALEWSKIRQLHNKCSVEGVSGVLVSPLLPFLSNVPTHLFHTPSLLASAAIAPWDCRPLTAATTSHSSLLANPSSTARAPTRY